MKHNPRLSIRTTDLLDRVKLMRKDLNTLKYNTEQMKEMYKDVFDASHHLFNAIVANKLDMSMLELMLNKMETKFVKPEESDNVDREMGKVLAEKYLYPTIGKQPELTKEQETILIRKVQEENKKSDEKLEKLNAGEISVEEFHENKKKINME